MKEIEKSKIHILIEIIEYVPNSVVSKTIMCKIFNLANKIDRIFNNYPAIEE